MNIIVPFPNCQNIHIQGRVRLLLSTKCDLGVLSVNFSKLRFINKLSVDDCVSPSNTQRCFVTE